MSLPLKPRTRGGSTRKIIRGGRGLRDRNRHVSSHPWCGSLDDARKPCLTLWVNSHHFVRQKFQAGDEH